MKAVKREANSYRRLDEREREELSVGLAQGRSLGQIAAALGRNKSSLSREVRRNCKSGEAYRATLAQQRSARRHRRRGRRLDRDERLRDYVHAGLRRQWSPEQIARRLAIDHPDDPTMRISHESIYTYLYVLPRGLLRKELLESLRHPRIHRRHRRGGERSGGPVADMLSIEERPAAVADRSIPGHWEGDLVCGAYNRTAAGTLVERTSRYLLLAPLAAKDAATVREAFAREIKTLPEQLRRSMTYDQGCEMAQHRLFTRDTHMIVYFAHPHSPWERGTNENTNGLIRQYFPKGCDFSKIPLAELKRVQDLLNNRPRKTLGWRTPNEVMAKLINPLQ